MPSRATLTPAINALVERLETEGGRHIHVRCVDGREIAGVLYGVDDTALVLLDDARGIHVRVPLDEVHFVDLRAPRRVLEGRWPSPAFR